VLPPGVRPRGSVFIGASRRVIKDAPKGAEILHKFRKVLKTERQLIKVKNQLNEED